MTTVTDLTSDLNPSTFGDLVTFDITVSPIVVGSVPTGFVELYFGSTPLTVLALDSQGEASYSTTSLPAGNLQIVAIYSGDSDYSASTDTLSQVVMPIATTMQLTSSNISSEFGETVSFSASVTATTGVPNGTISFYDDSLLLATVPVDGSGLAQYSTSTLSSGTHQIQAIYNGENNFGTSSETITQTVAPTTTFTSILSSTPNPANVNESITFIATAQSTNGMPDGVVSFYDGTQLLGVSPLLNGFAIFTVPSLSAGSHTIQAVYAGNDDFDPSTSASFTQTVSQPSVETTTALVSSVNPANAGEMVSFTATITSTSGVPTGTVTYYDGALALGTVLLNSNGEASFTTSALSPGSHNISAVYQGNSLFDSSSMEIEQVIGAATTMTTLVTVSPNPANSGETVTFIASIGSETGMPTGSVGFYDGGELIGTVQIYSGLAIFTYSQLSPGMHEISAVYNGNANFQPSTSPSYIEIVRTAVFPTTTEITSSRNPVFQGRKVAVSAVISTTGNPTGTVTFFDGANALGTVLVEQGTANFVTSDLSVGSHQISAYYSGDSSHSPSTSNSFIEVVKPNLRPNRPRDGKVHQIRIRAIHCRSFSNVLTWKAPLEGPAPTHYEIYRDAQLTKSIAEVSAKSRLSYKDNERGVKDVTDYYIVAVNEHGKSKALRVAVHSNPTQSSHSFSSSVESVLLSTQVNREFADLKFQDGVM